MPSLNDFVELTQELGPRPVLIMAQRCSPVRNRNSKCDRCVAICPIDETITIEKNNLLIDFERCVSCGACTTACPTNALAPLDPPDNYLAQQTAEAVLTLGGKQAVIACARKASKREADPRIFAEVPCVCRVDESLIVGLASHGVDDIVLVDGICRTCRFRDTQMLTDQVVESANNLLDLWGSTARVRRSSEFPQACLLAQQRGVYGKARREFFSKAGSGAKEAAVKTALKTLHIEKEVPTLREMLQVGSGRMPQYEPVRHQAILDALDRIGEVPQAEKQPSRLWGRVQIDEQKCNACGMCPVFCPTGALRRADDDDTKESGADLLLEFTASQCVQCDLCQVSCFRGCLTVEHAMVPEELFDFEPRLFTLSKRPTPAGMGFFGNRSFN